MKSLHSQQKSIIQKNTIKLVPPTIRQDIDATIFRFKKVILFEFKDLKGNFFKKKMTTVALSKSRDKRIFMCGVVASASRLESHSTGN